MVMHQTSSFSSEVCDKIAHCLASLESVTQLLKHLDKFKQISGLEINTNKTEALWLGYWRPRKDKPFGCKWAQEPVYALGIHFSYDLKRANTLNFEEKVCSLEKTPNNWNKRKLTLIGKINIVKTLGLSKLIYCSSLLTVSKSLIDRINKIISASFGKVSLPKLRKRLSLVKNTVGA